ncbi:hypothetical protein HK100_006756, partial [Physocladia obscura]
MNTTAPTPTTSLTATTTSTTILALIPTGCIGTTPNTHFPINITDNEIQPSLLQGVASVQPNPAACLQFCQKTPGLAWVALQENFTVDGETGLGCIGFDANPAFWLDLESANFPCVKFNATNQDV